MPQIPAYGAKLLICASLNLVVMIQTMAFWHIGNLFLILNTLNFRQQNHIGYKSRLQTGSNLDRIIGDLILCWTVSSAWLSSNIYYDIKAMHWWSLVKGIHRSPVYSPHKGAVSWKWFPCHDVIILRRLWVMLRSWFATLWGVLAYYKTQRIWLGYCPVAVAVKALILQIICDMFWRREYGVWQCHVFWWCHQAPTCAP